MNPDGGDQRQITQRNVPYESEDHGPTWSPDGRRIAFTRSFYDAQPAARQAVFVCNVDGSGLRRITPWQLNAGAPDWSPDGNLILFTSHYDLGQDGQEQLFTVRPDGFGMAKVTPSGFAQPSNLLGQFSPDGRKIVFVHFTPSASGPVSLVYTMNTDGSKVVLVSFMDDFYFAPTWGVNR